MKCSDSSYYVGLSNQWKEEAGKQEISCGNLKPGWSWIKMCNEGEESVDRVVVSFVFYHLILYLNATAIYFSNVKTQVELNLIKVCVVIRLYVWFCCISPIFLLHEYCNFVLCNRTGTSDLQKPISLGRYWTIAKKW